MTALIVAPVLAVLVIRLLRSPAVRQALAVALAAGAALAVAAGYGALVLAAAQLIGGGTLAVVVLLGRLVVPARTWRTS